MNSRYFICAFLVSAKVYAAESQSLSQCFEAALKRSEIIADQSEQITQAEEHYRQAIGSVLPTISGSASYQTQDNSASLSGFSPKAQPLVKLTLTQPLFRGFREFAALRQTKRLEEAQNEAKRVAVRQLFLDVSQNFFTVLSLEQDVTNLETEIGHYQKRIQELQGRVKIGRSRPTEVLSVEASQGLLRSQLEQVKGQLRAARELFAFLTGLAQDTHIKEKTKLSSELEPIEKFVTTVEARPDVKAAQLKLSAADEGIAIARGGHLPSIDVTGNYYLKRVGLLENVKWDVVLSLSLPIFSGGVVSSRVSEAVSQQMQSELALTRSKRLAEQEIRTLYETLQADIAQIAELDRATKLNERNFSEQSKEYRLGLVTNLDVLQALTNFQESKRALDRARYLGELDFHKLEAATGRNALISQTARR